MLKLNNELWNAYDRLQLAEQDFQNAEDDYIEIAALKLKAAEQEFNLLLQKAKEEIVC